MEPSLSKTKRFRQQSLQMHCGPDEPRSCLCSVCFRFSLFVFELHFRGYYCVCIPCVWALWPQIFHLQLGKNPILRAHLRSCQILLKFLQFVFFHLFVRSTLFPAVICHLPLCRLELSLQLLLQVLHPVCHVRNLMLWTAVYLPSSSPTTPSDESCAPYPVPGDNPEDTPLAR